MAYTVVKTLTDEDGTLHADAKSWTDKFGTFGLGRDDIDGNISANGTSQVILTRTFVNEGSWHDYQAEIYSKRGDQTFTSILTEEETS